MTLDASIWSPQDLQHLIADPYNVCVHTDVAGCAGVKLASPTQRHNHVKRQETHPKGMICDSRSVGVVYAIHGNCARWTANLLLLLVRLSPSFPTPTYTSRPAFVRLPSSVAGVHDAAHAPAPAHARACEHPRQLPRRQCAAFALSSQRPSSSAASHRRWELGGPVQCRGGASGSLPAAAPAAATTLP